MVLLMRLEVFGELGDATGKQGNLHFGRAGILVVGSVFANNFGFGIGSDRHRGKNS